MFRKPFSIVKPILKKNIISKPYYITDHLTCLHANIYTFKNEITLHIILSQRMYVDPCSKTHVVTVHCFTLTIENTKSPINKIVS